MNRTLQGIFSVCVVVMWILFGTALAAGLWTTEQWTMLIMAHIVCAIVFYNFALVFSYGYALSMLCISLLLMFKFANLPALLIGGLCAAYGLRLWQFVFARFRARQARGDLDTNAEIHARTPLGVRAFIWIMVSWLMTFMGMTIWLVGTRGTLNAWIVSGAIAMVLGLGLESIADNQKQIAKTTAPARWVDGGLFRRVRQVNYSGEVLFQIGMMIAGLGAAQNPREYVLVWIAPFYVIMLMIFQADTLDRQQQSRYGQAPDYQAWRQRSGRLLPF
jgi:hypothetical protein